MLRYLKRWTAEWEADLEARSEEVKDSSSGYTATIQFQQTMSFFKPLFKQLKRRQVDLFDFVVHVSGKCFSLDATGGQGLGSGLRVQFYSRQEVHRSFCLVFCWWPWIGATNKWLASTPGIQCQAAVILLTGHSKLLRIQQCITINCGGHER